MFQQAKNIARTLIQSMFINSSMTILKYCVDTNWRLSMQDFIHLHFIPYSWVANSANNYLNETFFSDMSLNFLQEVLTEFLRNSVAKFCCANIANKLGVDNTCEANIKKRYLSVYLQRKWWTILRGSFVCNGKVALCGKRDRLCMHVLLC